MLYYPIQSGLAERAEENYRAGTSSLNLLHDGYFSHSPSCFWPIAFFYTGIVNDTEKPKRSLSFAGECSLTYWSLSPVILPGDLIQIARKAFIRDHSEWFFLKSLGPCRMEFWREGFCCNLFEVGLWFDLEWLDYLARVHKNHPHQAILLYWLQYCGCPLFTCGVLKTFAVRLQYHRKYYHEYLENHTIEVNKKRLIGGGENLTQGLGFTFVCGRGSVLLGTQL